MEVRMNTDHSLGIWRELYKAAILEDDKNRLPERINAAKTAICDRVEELHTAGEAERAALHRAWNALHALEDTCRSESAKIQSIANAA
jgi:hypothetical protein